MKRWKAPSHMGEAACAVSAAIILLALAGCGPKGVPYGDFSQFDTIPWIDAHAHLLSHSRISDYVSYQDRFGMSAMVLQSPPNSSGLLTGGRPTYDAEALLAKALHPDRFYFFGGVDLTPLLTAGGEAALAADLPAQVNGLADAGADGIKLYFRNTFVNAVQTQTGFTCLPDNPSFSGLFTTAAARSLPVLIHIDAQYRANLFAAMDAYPGVTWIVTHLGFYGSDVDGLHAMLDARLSAGQDVYLDVGHFVHLGELMRDPTAGNFLIAHADRNMQGTDLGSGGAGLSEDECPTEEMAVAAAWKLRAMLETTRALGFTSAFTGQDVVVTGLGLPPETLQALYHDSAYALLGDPKPVTHAAGLAVIDRLISRTTDPADLARLQDIRALFSTACP